MTSLHFLNFYFSLNLLLALLSFFQRPKMHSSYQLRLQYFVLFSFFVFCILLLLSPSSAINNFALVEVLQSTHNEKISLFLNSPLHQETLKVSGQLPAKSSNDFIEWLGLSLVALAFLNIMTALWSLKKIIQESYLLRTLLNVKVFCSESSREPFSFYFWGKLFIVLPNYVFEKPKALQIILKHEIQHHRQNDTLWIYVLNFLRVLCFWNPLALFYLKKVDELQEFACDEVLISKKRIPPQAYAEHLYWVAQKASQSKLSLCALGFVSKTSQLKRRIEKMTITKKQYKSWIAPASTVLSLFCFLAAAWSAKSIVQDRKLSHKQATEIAKNMGTSEFDVSVNEEVLRSLNYFVGTEGGRTTMREALERMESYRTLVEGKLEDYSMPLELMAIPIVESGYQNLPETNKKGWGAGLWMFIKGTARNFGLRVDNKVDQRLDETLLTDAAMRLLSANKLRFKDWHLSVLAYYAGEGKVQKFIDKTKSRDAWDLVEAGVEEKRGYLANVIASAIIMKNPQLVQ